MSEHQLKSDLTDFCECDECQKLSEEEHSQANKEITKDLEKMADVGILLKQTDEILDDSGYALSYKFQKRLKDHYKIQDKIERMDRRILGHKKDQDYPESMTRDQYLIGITIGDFIGKTHTDCKGCVEIIMNRRATREEADKAFTSHMAKDHPEDWKEMLEQEKFKGVWIHLIQTIFLRRMNREWRSK